jgi:hypothetical protein
VSIEAITWALNTSPPDATPPVWRSSWSAWPTTPTPDGRSAFPAVATLIRYTRLSERSVHYALRDLEDLSLITPSDPDIVAAYIKRADRRQKGWALPVHSTIHNLVHKSGDGCKLGPTGCKQRRHGVRGLHPNRPLTIPRTVPYPDQAFTTKPRQ